MTKISYIASLYNGKEFLQKVLDNTLYHQTERLLEILVVDSCSTDGVIEEIESNLDNQDEIKRGRLRIIRQPQRTTYLESWLDGWKQAQGDLVGNLNVDDLFMPTATTLFHNAFTVSDENTVAFYGGYQTNKDGIPITAGIPPEFSREDFSNLFRGGPRLAWKNSLRDKVDWNKMYEAARQYKSGGDYWLMLYFLSLNNNYKFYRIPQILSIYNLRANSLENSNKELNTFESLRAIETFFPQSLAITNLKKDTSLYERYQQFKKQLQPK